MRRQKEPNASPRPPRSRLILAVLVGIPLLLVFGAGIVYYVSSRDTYLDVPKPALPPNNAFDDFVQAIQLKRKMKHESPYSMMGEPKQLFTLANFTACANDAPPVLATLRQGLKKSFVNTSDWSLDSDSDRLDSGFRDLSRVVSAVARYEELTGHPAQAMETRLDGMEMGAMLTHSSLLPGLTGMTCQAISLQFAEPLLPQLTTSELTHIASRMDEIIARRASYSDMLLQEGYVSTFQIQATLREGKAKNRGRFDIARDLIEIKDEKEVTREEQMQMLRFVLSSKEGMLRERLDFYKKCANAAKQPFIGKSSVPVPDNLLIHEFERTSLDDASLLNSRSMYLCDEAAATVLRTEVALYLYKALHYRFPDSLTELTPNYLKSLPNDPFGGAANIPLRYQVEENGRSFLLYSLGPDLNDDKGHHQPYPTAVQKGDIVAGYLYSWGKTDNKR